MRIGFIYKGGVQYFNDYTYPVPMQTMKIGVIYKIYTYDIWAQKLLKN